MQPMLTVLWGLVLFAERLPVLQWAGVVMVFGGIALLSVFGSTAPLSGGAGAPSGPGSAAAKANGR